MSIRFELAKELVDAYRKTHKRTDGQTIARLSLAAEMGVREYGRTKCGKWYVLHTSPTTGDGAISWGKSLEEILYLVALAGLEKGVDLEKLLDVREVGR